MKRRVLALDVGEARIGLAAGETGSGFAFGRGWIVRSRQAEDVMAVLEKAAGERAELVLVGLPRRTDGKDSAQTQKVRAFALALEQAGASVELEDERFTTRVAGQQIASSGLSRRDRQEKGRLDEASAILILESWLARNAD